MSPSEIGRALATLPREKPGSRPVHGQAFTAAVRHNRIRTTGERTERRGMARPGAKTLWGVLPRTP